MTTPNLKTSVYKNSEKKKYILTEEKREEYRRISKESRLAKSAATKGLLDIVHKENTPCLNISSLMPQLENNGLRTLSLFSGGGGLDLGFDRAGYEHIASYELIPICEETFKINRPNWKIYTGLDNGDVTKVDWRKYSNRVDVIHGGPPCQPFSIAGEQKGINDDRNMWGEFTRAVNSIKPKAFIAENVLGLLNPKFDGFVKYYILDELKDYHIVKFEMNAANYGVPQIRRRVFFVGFKNKKDFKKFNIPKPTHHNGFSKTLDLFSMELPKVFGVRKALGLSDIGYDNLAPTIRSGFTGKRNTTSILNSSAGQEAWAKMEIWPNGVQKDRSKASSFPAKNKHFRLSIDDVALLQGFPEDWKFAGAVYQQLGQIGNSVAPPVAYNVAVEVSKALV